MDEPALPSSATRANEAGEANERENGTANDPEPPLPDATPETPAAGLFEVTSDDSKPIIVVLRSLSEVELSSPAACSARTVDHILTMYDGLNLPAPDAHALMIDGADTGTVLLDIDLPAPPSLIDMLTRDFRVAKYGVDGGIIGAIVRDNFSVLKLMADAADVAVSLGWEMGLGVDIDLARYKGNHRNLIAVAFSKPALDIRRAIHAYTERTQKTLRALRVRVDALGEEVLEIFGTTVVHQKRVGPINLRLEMRVFSAGFTEEQYATRGSVGQRCPLSPMSPP